MSAAVSARLMIREFQVLLRDYHAGPHHLLLELVTGKQEFSIPLNDGELVRLIAFLENVHAVVLEAKR